MADLVVAATDALQAQERFSLALKKSNETANNVKKEVTSVLDKLRDIKSELEGTAVVSQLPLVDEDVSNKEIKPLILNHLPGTMNVDVKQKLKELIVKSFQGKVKKVIYAGLVTCPWYKAMHSDRGIQAKENSVFVVYVNHNKHVFSPLNPHHKEQEEVLDQGWFYASEVFHFCQHLVKGKSRFVEVLQSNDNCTIFEEEEWLDFKQKVNLQEPRKLKGFLEQCRGEAVGGIARKKKSGKMGLRDGVTLHDFCTSFRRLQYATEALSELPLSDTIPDQPAEGSLVAEARAKLSAAYQGEPMREEMFDVVMRWKSEVDNLMKTVSYTDPGNIGRVCGEWLARVRLEGGELSVPKPRSTEDEANCSKLLKEIGGNVGKMRPENIIMIAQAGSYLYGLNTPTSDVDFVVIYASPTQEVISACKRPTECFENRGPQLEFEYGSYEARLFGEMLLKGSVVMVELVFADNLNYISQAWKELVSQRKQLVNEKVILQYFGLIKNNMVMIENGRHKNQPRERKLFYQIFYKLHTLEYFLKGEVPPIKCTGDIKDFIMKIRKEPLEGEFARDRLFQLAKEKINNMRLALANRKSRLQENIDFQFLTSWLLNVRGLT